MEELVKKIIKFIDPDPNRHGLKDTPERVVRSWSELYSGYRQKPEDILKTQFEESFDDAVILRDIEMYSMCEHHMLPFIGKVHIGYIPEDGKVVGISKLARLVECFARRLQIQERLTNQIAESIQKHLKPLGVGVIIEAKHLCMLMRGVSKQNSVMVTSSMYGVFREDGNSARLELLSLIRR